MVGNKEKSPNGGGRKETRGASKFKGGARVS